MNLLGTHDTERILTVLGDNGTGENLENPELAVKRLSESDRAAAKQLLRMASTLQFTVFGVPSVYYGDEAGLEGYHDPFCRMPFPWGREDAELLEHYRTLGRLRREHPSLSCGDFRFLACTEHAFAFERFDVKSGDRLTVAANMGDTPFQFHPTGSRKALTVEPRGIVIK
jgi:glycosidase